MTFIICSYTNYYTDNIDNFIEHSFEMISLYDKRITIKNKEILWYWKNDLNKKYHVSVLCQVFYFCKEDYQYCQVYDMCPIFYRILNIFQIQ